jgi:two-component system, OmpR family, sensor kinase
MKVRTRLVLSFSYVLLVVIVALTLPLTVVLRDRARSSLEAQALTNAQTIAAFLDGQRLEPGRASARLAQQAERFAADVQGRVVVLDGDGTVLADSDGEDVGQDFATPGRPEVAEALSSMPTAGVRLSEDEGGEIVVAAAPVIEEGELVGAVRVSRSVADVQRNVTRATVGIVVVALAGLVAGLVLAFVLARSLARPLSNLATTARRFGRGDLRARAGELEGGDEVEQLAASFDEMADRLERNAYAQREFVANASHQLRTPLTGMKLRLGSALADTDDPELRRQILAAEQEVDRLAGIVERLLVMARDIEEGKDVQVDVADAAARAAERWEERARQGGAELHVEGHGGVALADPDDLDQVFDVLLDNAIAYAPGPVEVWTGRNGSRVVVRVQDHGGGIPADELPRVTERFYRGREAPAGGSGIGLSIAKELVEKWGGSLVVAAGESDGTRIEVRLRPVGSLVTP